MKGSRKFSNEIRLYEEMTRPDIEEALSAGAHIMIPIGATEQHGAHLPLGTDNMVGIDIVRRAGSILAKEGIPLIMGPVIGFGLKPFLTETPRDYVGTINLSSSTLKALLEEVCMETIKMGFRTLYLLKGHAESDVIVQLVAKELSEKTPAHVIALNGLIGIRSRYKGILKSKREEGHGGEGETSRILATAPHLVRLNLARPCYPRKQKGAEIEADRLPYLGGGIGRYKPFDRMFDRTHQGINGDPTLATAETGEKVYNLITDWVVQIVRKEWQLIHSAKRKRRRPATA
jgi:creatinine amidohydrolase